MSFRREWDETEVARDLAAMVVGFRAERGLSQEELGVAVGLAAEVVAQLESGLGPGAAGLLYQGLREAAAGDLTDGPDVG